MIHRLAIAAALIASSSCSTYTRYEREPWAGMSLEQANAECDDAVARNPLTSHELCMRAKGWQAR